MKSKQFSVATLVSVLGLVTVMGCGGLEEELEVGQNSAALWTVGSTSTYVEWDSGRSTSLSGWQSIDCYSSYGSSYLLSGLRGFKEPNGNADNFIARLNGRCYYHKNVAGNYVQTSLFQVENIYSSNYRASTGTLVKPPTNGYPSGLALWLPINKKYVKDLNITYVKEQYDVLGSYDNMYITGATLKYHGWNLEFLDCPDQHVVTGLKLKYDTRNGKIRRMRIYCRLLQDL